MLPRIASTFFSHIVENAFHRTKLEHAPASIITATILTSTSQVNAVFITLKYLAIKNLALSNSAIIVPCWSGNAKLTSSSKSWSEAFLHCTNRAELPWLADFHPSPDGDDTSKPNKVFNIDLIRVINGGTHESLMKPWIATPLVLRLFYCDVTVF